MSAWVEPNKKRGESKREHLVIDWTKRLNLSVWGNPRFDVHFTDGTAHTTKSDASVSYDVDNFTGREYRGKPVDVVLTRAGRIIYMRLSEES